MTYVFRPVTLDDIDMLNAWQAYPHVREWWGRDEPYDQNELNDPRVSRWIVTTDGGPFAFMQDYSVHGWDDHHFADLPAGSRGIDQYIGQPEMVGVGHGSAFIGARMQTLFDAGAPMIATDPHPDNTRAIAVYTKLGFQASGPPSKTPWGLVLPMVAQRNASLPKIPSS
ncbi:MAG: GNAT family N-acetyltransferase [Marinosulfonomonas sp.]